MIAAGLAVAVMSFVAATGTFAATVFRDVPPTHWAFDSIQWASGHGIMTGPGDRPGTFDPAGTVNRAQLATALARHNNALQAQINDLQVRLHLLELKLGVGSPSPSANSSSSAQSFSAMLTGGQETPAVSTSATGDATFTWNGTSLTYDITVRNLSSAITAAHFHTGAPGVAGPVAMPISFSGNHATGTWSNLSPQQRADLMAGRLYVNVHATNHPDGEIRGQVTLNTGGSSSMMSPGSALSSSSSVSSAQSSSMSSARSSSSAASISSGGSSSASSAVSSI